jgi:hypothetical protein
MPLAADGLQRSPPRLMKLLQFLEGGPAQIRYWRKNNRAKALRADDQLIAFNSSSA